MQDQNGNVHEYDFDGLARRLADIVSLLGAGVDGAVRRIDTAYDIRGMMNLITSRAGTAADSTIVNQVLRQFNNFAQLQKEYQQHDGPVNTLASPLRRIWLRGRFGQYDSANIDRASVQRLLCDGVRLLGGRRRRSIDRPRCSFLARVNKPATIISAWRAWRG